MYCLNIRSIPKRDRSPISTLSTKPEAPYKLIQISNSLSYLLDIMRETIEYHNFDSKLLEAYFFTISTDDEIACGYDQYGRAWREQELVEMRVKGSIVKECPCKNVFLKNLSSLLGYIQECFDGTWLAHSPYYPPNMDGMEVAGFINEFYAVQYLHQVAAATYRDEVGDCPCLPWQQ